MPRARPRPKKYLRKLALRQPCVHGEPGLDLRPYQIVLRPLVTEKGTHQSTRYNAYAFQVNPLATKTQIKAAVEELFNVKVEAVRTQVREGKKVRTQAAMATFESTRPAVGAQAVGIARAAYEYALDYAKERKQFGRAIIENQGIAFKLADMKTAIEASRLLVWRADHSDR